MTTHAASCTPRPTVRYGCTSSPVAVVIRSAKGSATSVHDRTCSDAATPRRAIGGRGVVGLASSASWQVDRGRGGSRGAVG